MKRIKTKHEKKIFRNQAEEKAFADVEMMKGMFGGDSDLSGSSRKAQPEKVIPAKEAYTIRKKTITIKEF